MTEAGRRPSAMRGRHEDELARLLRRYAEERLGLHPGAARRLRERFLLEARRRTLDLTVVGSSRAELRPTAESSKRLRRPAVALLAAALALAALAGAALASGPGGPLYGVRLWVEGVTLPADAHARAEAEIARLEARLSEATEAANHGNGAAVRAALEAYRESVASALQAAGDDLERADRLEIVLERHQVVLDTLAERLPAPAAEAVKRTIERNEATIEKIKTQGKPSSTPGIDSESPHASPVPGETPSGTPTEPPEGPPSPKPGRTPPGPSKPTP